MKALNAFKAGEMQALVATDVAARGIDIEELPYVVNYELPHTPEDYVHRIGRTGRAGNLGNALSLVSADETGYLADIEKLINKPIHQVVVPGFEPEDDWCYPPSGKKRDRSALNSNRGAERNDRTERNSRSERNERTERRPERAERPQQDRSRSHYTPKPSTIAADGFDFNKPYQATVSNTDATPTAEKPSTPMRRSGKMVAALLGGIKKPQP
jgi:ATP-dependent RNA helicase RhlE